MKDKKLHLFCKEFVENSLSIIKLVSNIPVPMKEVLSVKFKENRSGYETTSKQVPDLYLFVFQMYDKIEGSLAFKSFTNYMLENDEIKQFYTDYEIRKSIPTTFLVKFFSLKGTVVAKFDEECFNKIYESFEKYLYSKSVPYKVFIPIPNLEIETKELALDDNLKIRNLSEKEFGELVNAFSFPFPSAPSIRFLSPESLILERTFEVRKNPKVVVNSPTNEQNAETRNLFNKVVTALRLFKKGGIGYDAVFSRNLSDWDTGGFSIHSSLALPYFSGPRYILNRSEEKKLVRFWHFLKGVNLKTMDKNLRRAINRFDSAYERKDPEDSLIDYAIALTSLFSRGDEAGVGRYRLSIRAALLLGRKTNEREKIRQEVLEIYDKRSDIVHGRDIKKFRNFKDLRDLADSAEEYTRRSIKALLQLDAKFGGRRKAIDSIEKGLLSALIDFDLNFA